MVKLTKALVLSLFVLLLVSLFSTSSSFAEEETTADDVTAVSPTLKRLKPPVLKERIQNAREKNIEIKENMKARASEAATRRKEKLSEARLRMCEQRAKNIGNRLKSMQSRARVIHQGHEKIYLRVDEFYNNKLVPNGYILLNYADLKAEIEANKANVVTLLEAAKTSGTDFDCSSEDPKGQVDAFHEDMKALIEANKEYKESIHIFTKAVRDLAKTVTPIKITPSEEAAE